MFAAGDEHISSVSTEGIARLSRCSKAGGFIGVMYRHGQVCGQMYIYIYIYLNKVLGEDATLSSKDVVSFMQAT